MKSSASGLERNRCTSALTASARVLNASNVGFMSLTPFSLLLQHLQLVGAEASCQPIRLAACQTGWQIMSPIPAKSKSNLPKKHRYLCAPGHSALGLRNGGHLQDADFNSNGLSRGEAAPWYWVPPSLPAAEPGCGSCRHGSG